MKCCFHIIGFFLLDFFLYFCPLSLTSLSKKHCNNDRSFLLLTHVPQVYLSIRSGAWVIRQVSDNGLPVDRFNTRFVNLVFKLLPMSLLNWFGEKKLNAMYDHAMYGLKPKHRYDIEIFLLFVTL